MKSTTLDPCFFYKSSSNGPIGLQVVQVDDTCGGGTEDFALLEASQSKKFDCKEREEQLPIKFNGMRITQCRPDGYFFHQNDYCASVELPHISHFKSKSSVIEDKKIQTHFKKIRGQISYGCPSTRPDLAYYGATLS